MEQIQLWERPTPVTLYHFLLAHSALLTNTDGHLFSLPSWCYMPGLLVGRQNSGLDWARYTDPYTANSKVCSLLTLDKHTGQYMLLKARNVPKFNFNIDIHLPSFK